MPGSRRLGTMNLHQVHAAMSRHVDRSLPIIHESKHRPSGIAKARRLKRRRKARH